MKNANDFEFQCAGMEDSYRLLITTQPIGMKKATDMKF